MARLFTRTLITATAALAVSSIPSWVKLPGPVPTAVEGVNTLDDGLQACRATGLRGWELVEYARLLVHRKFVYYSTRNLWDSPGRAFQRGMGYCTQYNLSLKYLLDHLGFETEAVFCLHIRVAEDPAWGMGHTWLRVTIQGETRDVCAGRLDTPPGCVRFEPVAPVWRGNAPVLALTQLGMIPFCGAFEWAALLSGKGDPGWTFRPLDR